MALLQLPNTSCFAESENRKFLRSFCSVFSHLLFFQNTDYSSSAPSRQTATHKKYFPFVSTARCLFCQVSRTRNSIASVYFISISRAFFCNICLLFVQCISLSRGNRFSSALGLAPIPWELWKTCQQYNNYRVSEKWKTCIIIYSISKEARSVRRRYRCAWECE